MGEFSPWHLLILAAVLVLLFGANKLPQMARSVGQSMRIFKSEVDTMRDDSRKSTTGSGTADSPGASSSSGSAGTPSQPISGRIVEDGNAQRQQSTEPTGDERR